MRLLNRTTRRVSLTEAGHQFCGKSRHVLDVMDEAEAEVAGLQAVPRGILRISCVVTLAERWMSQIIADFLLNYPEVEIDLLETDRPVDLIRDDVDLALVTGKLADSSYRVRQLSSFERVVVGAPQYLDRAGRP